jgi:hypothetical protein
MVIQFIKKLFKPLYIPFMKRPRGVEGPPLALPSDFSDQG